MDRTNRFEVIQPGISISSNYSTTGTLGLIVYDNKNHKAPCILSNWHILAKASWIPRISFKKGRPIYQPGKAFQRRPSSNIVGKLLRHDRRTDSALAEIVNREFHLQQLESNALITSFREPKTGDIVEKSGAKTGVTRGKVMSVYNHYATIKPLAEGNPNDEEISEGGDSGSVWYDPETMEGLVLHRAGDGKSAPNKEFAAGWSLGKVMERLDFSLTPEG